MHMDCWRVISIRPLLHCRFVTEEECKHSQGTKMVVSGIKKAGTPQPRHLPQDRYCLNNESSAKTRLPWTLNIPALPLYFIYYSALTMS